MAEHLAIAVSEVKNVVVWGNATSLQVPDAQHGTVMRVAMDKVLDSEFMEELAVSVQQRGNVILQVQGGHSCPHVGGGSSAADQTHQKQTCSQIYIVHCH